MSKRVRKITVNIPTEVLDAAMQATGAGLTATVVAGLRELERKSRRSALRALRGTIDFDLDLDSSRR